LTHGWGTPELVKDQPHNDEPEQNTSYPISRRRKRRLNSEFLEVDDAKNESNLKPNVREPGARCCNPGSSNHNRNEKNCEAGDGIEFWGQSFICAPSGEIIAKGSVDREEIVLADVDWQDVDRHRTHWPFLRDRRVDAYGDMNQRLVD